MNNFIGCIAGDIIGSYYEHHNAATYDDIVFFVKGSRFTDDSVLACACAEWLLDTKGGTVENQKDVLIDAYQKYANVHPNAGYGGSFRNWFLANSREPIGSCGNGAGMRVAACGYYAKTLEEALELAKKSAEVTHNHVEGIKGAQAITEAIFLARTGKSKETIKKRITEDFGYDLDRKIDDIQGTHPFDATCQVTCPEAIIAFLEGDSFEDVIRKAIWVGGDSDTIACMAGGIAGAYYGVPSWIQDYVLRLLPEDLKDIVKRFDTEI